MLSSDNTFIEGLVVLQRWWGWPYETIGYGLVLLTSVGSHVDSMRKFKVTVRVINTVLLMSIMCFHPVIANQGHFWNVLGSAPPISTRVRYRRAHGAICGAAIQSVARCSNWCCFASAGESG